MEPELKLNLVLRRASLQVPLIDLVNLSGARTLYWLISIVGDERLFQSLFSDSFVMESCSESTPTWLVVSFHESLCFCQIPFCLEFTQCCTRKPCPLQTFCLYSLISTFSLLSDTGRDDCLWEDELGTFSVMCPFFTIYLKIWPLGVHGVKREATGPDCTLTLNLFYETQTRRKSTHYHWCTGANWFSAQVLIFLFMPDTIYLSNILTLITSLTSRR